MRKLRTGTPQPEEWDVDDIMSHLNIDKDKAEAIMKECRKHNGISGYGPVEKHLILDFINMKQREERDREARYKADLANVEISTTLREQVKTLREHVNTLKEQVNTLREQNNVLREQDVSLQRMCDSSSADARKAHTQSLIANFISGISIVIAVLALVLKLN